MDKNFKNDCIECTVVQCANHSCDGNFCALNKIRVGTHESEPTEIKCTDCESFVPGTGTCNF